MYPRCHPCSQSSLHPDEERGFQLPCFHHSVLGLACEFQMVLSRLRADDLLACLARNLVTLHTEVFLSSRANPSL